MTPATYVAGEAALSHPAGARGRRGALLGGILVAHAALLAVVAVNRSTIDRPAPAGSRLTIIDVAEPTPHAAPARIVPPPTPAAMRHLAPTLPPAASLVSSTVVADNSMPGQGGCDLTDTLQAALRSDPLARAAVASLPVAARSVANAVMLWDGRAWTTASGAQEQGSLGIIRRVTSEVVRSASQECRDQPQAGPRLIVMPGAPDVTLALGSGRWRWGDLTPDAVRGDESPQRVAATGWAFPGEIEFSYRIPIATASSGAAGSYLNIMFMKNDVLQGVR